MDYFERKKLTEEIEKYRTLCRLLAVILIIVGILWYVTDNGRIERIKELKTQVEKYEEQIESWKEEAGY